MGPRVSRVVCACLLLASGCGRAVMAPGVVMRPAAVPIRSFPHIVFVPAEGPESRAMARRLASHVDSDEVRVELRSRSVLEASRSSLGPASVVVSITVNIGDRSGTEWQRRPDVTCDPGGCVEMLRPRLSEVTVVEGAVRLRVRGRAVGRTLQDMTAEAFESGDDPLGARLRVRERLARRVLGWMDQRLERVRVRLLPVDDVAFDEALEAAAEGRWGDAREQVEARFSSGAPDSWSPEIRARALYDLGVIRRFAPGGPERFGSARAALERAVRLQPTRRYSDALEALTAHERASQQLRAQRAARLHNFRLHSLHVPDGYSEP
ncbi:MAG: hypothetical protein AB8I08_30235 [Sandaracinaceae bacterium]